MLNNFSIKDIRDFWDGVSVIYESTNKKLGYVHTQRFEKTLEYGNFKPNMSVLNIWSRTGNLIPYLRKVPNLTIANREASPKMIAMAKQKHPSENFALTDLEHLPELADNSIDRVVSLETLEHVPNPSAFLKELHRILKIEGLLIMSLPPRGFEIPTQIYELFFKNHGEGPHQFLWPSEVKSLLQEAGFKLQAHRPTIILPLGNDKLTRLSEKVFMGIFGKTPLVNFGVRHFYIATK